MYLADDQRATGLIRVLKGIFLSFIRLAADSANPP
jgi:hypothetical protein